MNFIKRLRIVAGVAAAAFALVGMTTAASASTVQPCATNSGLTCLVDQFQFGSGNSGNDKEASVEAALAAALGLTSIDLTLLGKSGSFGPAVSGKSGTWTVPSAVSYVTVKAANSYLIFNGGNALTGPWSTMGIINGGGNQPNVSHISYWSGGPAQVIPLPAGGVLLLTGLLALGLRRRRT